jgi:hypothetical protein
MANCLYSGDKPLGLVQSTASDISYGGGSVADTLDDLTQYHIKVVNRLLTFNNSASSNAFDFTDIASFNKIVYVGVYSKAITPLMVNSTSAGEFICYTYNGYKYDLQDLSQNFLVIYTD